MAKKKAAVKSNGRAVSSKPLDSGVFNAELLRVVTNSLSSSLGTRARLAQAMLDPRRDIADECGYKAQGELQFEDYKFMYDRTPIGARVVQVMPAETWKTQPEVFETEDIGEETPFELAWAELGKQLRGQSWYGDQKGNPVWEYISRADKLSGIGRYGALLLGLDDGDDLEQPVQEQEGRQLLYLRALDESQATIADSEKERKNPRFGLPTMYSLQLGSVGNTVTAKVHWSRVLHIVDNMDSSEVYGVPRMQHVFNNVFDLYKLLGGSAEMFWKGAFPGMSIETHPSLGPDAMIDQSGLRDTMEKYWTGLQRYMSIEGAAAKMLAPTVADPTPHIDVQLEVICILIGVPKRVFLGSERGELASSQDSRAWNSRLEYRQNNNVTPRLIVPFVDRLIQLKVLPEPGEDGYNIVWPDLDTLTELEVATVAVQMSEAMAKYVQGGVTNLIQPLEYLTRILGFDPDVAEEVLKSTVQYLKENPPPEPEPAPTATAPKPQGQGKPKAKPKGV